MATKKTGLGKGLDALFGSPIQENTEEENQNLVKYLKIIDIEPNVNQARKVF